MKKTILITGGTGFLGRRLGKYFREGGNEVLLTGRNHDQIRIAQEFSGCKAIPSDVANLESVRDVFAEVKPNIVIHAAASKYVDTAEANPMECLDVNILGSQNVARTAIDNDVETVVGISTDKAAPPVANTYGLTKALMERVYCAMNNKTATNFVCVRFGNMPWSTGSVFPIWRRMQEETGIIKSTGPHMTRLLIPVEEAVQLVGVAIGEIDSMQGGILCPSMKTGLISEFLDVWVDKKGGKWEQVSARPGERTYEHLIGEAELEYTAEILVNQKKYYFITPNNLANNPLQKLVSSVDAEKFNKDEMWEIINNPPPDVL